MSDSCSLFFNLVADSNISEIQTRDIDLFLSHDFEDDRNLRFSDYACQLRLYKLSPRVAGRVADDFVNHYAQLRSAIDYKRPPMLVYNVDELVSFVSENGNLEFIEDADLWKSDPVMVALVERMIRALAG